jgi:hypothetical protein
LVLAQRWGWAGDCCGVPLRYVHVVRGRWWFELV